MFQSTHPRGVRLLRQVLPSLLSYRFNPRTREGCDCQVSLRSGCIRRFNPRTREGCDIRLERILPSDLLVSIHAPARGATLRLLFNQLSLTSFNPRTREGCDDLPFIDFIPCFLFQSTHPRGVRPSMIYYNEIDKKFQSTHPRGVRPSCARYETRHGRGFNPRTREGCDHFRGGCLMAKYRFNPRTREGCDRASNPCPSPVPAFQSTHPRGVRQESWEMLIPTIRFNPRTREGCDETGISDVERCCVSIHAPARGATK